MVSVSRTERRRHIGSDQPARGVRPTPERGLEDCRAAREFLALASQNSRMIIESKQLMPIETDRAKVSVEELATRIRSEMVPLGTIFSYFLVTPIADEDLKQYLEDPIAALPPAISAALPKVGILLVPYL